MFSNQELAIVSDVDFSKINPEMSDFDQKVEMANQLVHKWMMDKENRDYLDDRKAEYIHGKGWTVNKGFKHECDIPSEAFMLLPRQIRNDRKQLMKWAKQYHPYLFHNQIT